MDFAKIKEDFNHHFKMFGALFQDIIKAMQDGEVEDYQREILEDYADTLNPFVPKIYACLNADPDSDVFMDAVHSLCDIVEEIKGADLQTGQDVEQWLFESLSDVEGFIATYTGFPGDSSQAELQDQEQESGLVRVPASQWREMN